MKNVGDLGGGGLERMREREKKGGGLAFKGIYLIFLS